MTAADVDALAKLREVATAWFHESGLVHSTAVREWCECQQAADLLLSGPLAPLLAEVRRGRALREAVEGLIERHDNQWPRVVPTAALRAVVAAVDGGEQR